MLPESLLTDHGDSCPARRPLLPLAITVFIAGFLVIAGVFMLKDPRGTQRALCDSGTMRVANAIEEFLLWAPIGHDYDLVVGSIFAGVGLTSASCTVAARHLAPSEQR